MRRKLMSLFVLVALLVLFTSSVALAASGSACPPGFHLEEVMDHEHHHQHVGTSADQNGDGLICMRHVTADESIHVHVDNNLP